MGLVFYSGIALYVFMVYRWFHTLKQLSSTNILKKQQPNSTVVDPDSANSVI